MSFRARLCFMLAALLLASATLSLGSQDPELKQCKHQCRALKQTDEHQIQSCDSRCEEYDRQKHGGPALTDDDENDRSPIQRLRDCNKRCESHEPGQRREGCQTQCQQEYDREKEKYEKRGRSEHKHYGSDYQQCRQDCREGRRESWSECEESCDRRRRGGGNREEEMYGRGEERWEKEGAQSQSPYVFEDQHFFTGMKSQHGSLRILQKFTDRSEELLRGIENFRVGIFEAQPQTFVVPNHWDADTIIFVANGRGTVSVVRQEKRESFSIKEGDLFRIRSGTTTYLVNRDNNERLVLVKLYQPVNNPGEFEAFFGAGGENRESYLKAFSHDILEAAFNVRGDRLRRIFGQERQGAIIKASEEQIRSMSHHQEGGIWPFGGESKGSHNLYDRRPTFSNEYGQYYEVDSTQFRQLRDLDVDVAISIANISEGAMTAPYYNSKATEINVVVEGEGYFEMACPHLSRSQSRGQEEQYKRFHPFRRESRGATGYETVRSRLRRGTVFVAPAGHPTVVVASSNQNLQILSFKVNANDNEQNILAGRRNVMNQVEREAKELAFGMPAREVEEVFRSQQEEFFFRGPRRGRSEF